jgi:hypothetical protein
MACSGTALAFYKGRASFEAVSELDVEKHRGRKEQKSGEIA